MTDFPQFAERAVRISAEPRDRSDLIRAGYLRHLAMAMLIWLGLSGAIILIVDPYGISPIHLSIAHVNRYRPKRLDIDRLIKPYEVWRYQPRTVFLGTSRIHQSIDPAVLDATRFAPAYNASVPANNLGMNISYFREYIQLDQNIQNVFVELFLYNFLGQDQVRSPPNSFGEMLKNTGPLFLSTDALWDALFTLRYNIKVNAPCYEIKGGGYFYYPPGSDGKGSFDAFPAGMWAIDRLEHGNPTLNPSAFTSIEELIDTARRHHVSLTFLITPEHPYFWYYIETIDRWDLIADWLTRLSAITPVLSFAQPNAWTYEPVGHHMTYWNDPFHFSLAMGRGMEESLAGMQDPNLPKNFVIPLTPDRVPQYISNQREALLHWAHANPSFVAAFEAEKRRRERQDAR